MTARRNPLKMVAAGLMLAFGAAILAAGMTAEKAASRDYISYWAAGRLLVQHQNPYDHDLMLRMEQSAGYAPDRPLFMRNAPTAFVLAYPLGFTGPRMGAILWSLGLVFMLVISVRLLWIVMGRPPDRLHLLGYLFPPVLACLLHGQMGILLLFGVACFLCFYDSRPYLAGAALAVLAVKPHLFLPFGVVLIAWSLYERRFRVCGAAATAMLCMLAFGYAVDPGGWQEYAGMMQQQKLSDEMIPTISLGFRLLIHRGWDWLQFVPAGVGSAWALWHWWKKRNAWVWRSDGAILLAVSVMVAPYAWFTDESLALPAVLLGIYRARARSLIVYAVLAGVALVEVLMQLPVNSGFYLWTAPAWVVWSAVALRTSGARREEQAAAERAR